MKFLTGWLLGRIDARLHTPVHNYADDWVYERMRTVNWASEEKMDGEPMNCWEYLGFDSHRSPGWLENMTIQPEQIEIEIYRRAQITGRVLHKRIRNW